MQDINKFVDSFPAPTRGERLNMALISLLMALNDKVDKVLPAESNVPQNARMELTEASEKKATKKNTKKVIK